jgi:hypothetical protein
VKRLKSTIAKVLTFVFLFASALSSTGTTASGAPSVNYGPPSQVYFGSIVKWKDKYLALADFERNATSTSGTALFAARDDTLQEWDAVYFTGSPGKIAFNDTYVAVTYSDMIRYSTDALNWTQASLLSGYSYPQNIYSIDGTFLVTAYKSSDGQNVLLATTDFISFTEAALPSSSADFKVENIKYHNGALYYISYAPDTSTGNSNATIFSTASLSGSWNPVGTFVRQTGGYYQYDIRWNEEGAPVVYGYPTSGPSTTPGSLIVSTDWMDWIVASGDGLPYSPASDPSLVSEDIICKTVQPQNETTSIRINQGASFVPYVYWNDALIHPRNAGPTPTPLPGEDHDAVKYVPFSTFINIEDPIPSGATFTYELYSGNKYLPDGIELDSATGEIFGVPQKEGTYRFTAKITVDTGSSSYYYNKSYNILVQDNLDSAVDISSDTGYEFVAPDATETFPQLDGTIRSIEDYLLKSNGNHLEFRQLYIDGELQADTVDYTYSEGSTKIIVKAQTIEKYGEGSHTVAAKFLSSDSNGHPTMKRAALNYNLDLGKPISQGSSSSNNSSAAAPAPLSTTIKASVNGKTATAILTALLLKQAGDAGDAITVTSPLGDVVLDTAAVKDIGFSSDVTVTYSVETQPFGEAVISASLTRKGNEIGAFGKGILTISIPYTLPNGVRASQVVPYSNRNNVLDLVMGGYNATTKKVDLHLRHLSDYVVRISDKQYEGRGGWYDESLDWAVQRGLFDKYIVDGKINVAQDVSRADFVAALLKSMGIQTLDSYRLNQFADVSGENSEYILTARQLGIVAGIGNNLFAPDSTSKRGEQFQIVYNLIQANLTSVEGQGTNRKLSDFRDGASVPQWLRPALTELVRLGIVEGDGTNLNVEDNFSIGQISVVLQKMASPKAAA